MTCVRSVAVLSLLVLGTDVASGAGVRDNTRLFRRDATSVSEAQASDLTMTLTDAATRSIQTWVRTAGTLDPTGTIVTVLVRGREASLVDVGQRVRVFSITSRMQMRQGKVTRVTPVKDGVRAQITLADHRPDTQTLYLAEIVVDRGRFLSIPNVAIIEEESGRVVYVKAGSDQYARRQIRTGLQGELYTEVLEGLKEDDQVVSIGSFFVDADDKLKSGEPSTP